MKSYREKELIIFEFDNGKRATYNLNTGETIGKQGTRVQSLSSAFAGMDIKDVLSSFTDEKYRAFILHIYENFTPQSYRYYSRGSRVKNLGTLFSYVNRYKIYEQYYIAGLHAESTIKTPITEVPKGLLKLCRKYERMLTDKLIKDYKTCPDLYNVIFSMEFEGVDDYNLWTIAEALVPRERLAWRWHDESHCLLKEFNYNLKALLKYVDYLATFEGLNVNAGLMGEIGDYANMMSKISDKYEKYPRHFLSTHRIASRNYERLKHQFDEQNFQKQITPEYEITHKDYKFFYPRSTQEIKDEAVQQQNCVASYINKVINGGCHILFLRKKDNPTKSLVTIEVRNGKIVQAFQAYNTPCTEEQQEAIAAFNKKFSKEVAADA